MSLNTALTRAARSISPNFLGVLCFLGAALKGESSASYAAYFISGAIFVSAGAIVRAIRDMRDKP